MRSAEPTAHFLMGNPRHFAVTYRINPWMDPARWARDERALAVACANEWDEFRAKLEALGARIEEITGEPGLPDLVFTANSAVVLDGKALLAHFRHPERQAEEPHFAAAFHRLQARGLIDVVRKLPDGLVLEGAGDCVWDAARRLFWFGVDVVPLGLTDPRFYHLDTALCALPRGEVIYLPQAFVDEGVAAIRNWVEAEHRIEITPKDASLLAANAVCVGDTIVMAQGASLKLRNALRNRGYRVVTTSLGSFRRSGGAAFCLTLRLDWRSGVDASEVPVVATAR
jgi:N-dimethylarginine dimethylaminohydrolase